MTERENQNYIVRFLRRKRFSKSYSLKKESKASLKRDFILIIFGAVISFTTSIVTQVFNYSHQVQQKKFERKLLFYDKFSTQVGERLFVTWEFFKSVRDNDTAKIQVYFKKYNEKREEYASSQYNYSSALAIDFGEEIRENFINIKGTGLLDSIILFGNEVMKQYKIQYQYINTVSINNRKAEWKIKLTNQYVRLANRADSLFQKLYIKMAD